MNYMTRYCAGSRAWERALKSVSEMKWTLAWIHGGYRQFCSTFGWSHSWMLGLCPVGTCWKNTALTGEGGSWGAAEPGASICGQALPPGAPQPQHGAARSLEIHFWLRPGGDCMPVVCATSLFFSSSGYFSVFPLLWGVLHVLWAQV